MQRHYVRGRQEFVEREMVNAELLFHFRWKDNGIVVNDVAVESFEQLYQFLADCAQADQAHSFAVELPVDASGVFL